MEYKEAIDYILSFTDYEKTSGVLYSASNYDLRRTEGLLHLLGDPHLTAQTVHIVGTKGKGSTAAMMASVLQTAGYRTGLFTSPHLHTFRERITVDGEKMSEEQLADLIAEIKPKAAEIHRGAYGKLTTFEILVALGFAHFQRSGVDFQVLEAGMGGRLDATNVVHPLVCIITSISLDHTEVLGKTYEEIAREKAGIIKPGTTVVSSPQRPEVIDIIEDTCHQNEARLIWVGSDVTWEKESADLSGQIFQVHGKRDDYLLTIPLIGDHQLENAATAVAALEVIDEAGMKVPRSSLVVGLSQVRWPGRLEVLQTSPLVVVDGAHNAYSASKLRQAVEQYFNYRRLILIVGTSSDKDIPGIVEELVPLSEAVIIARSRHPRSAQPSAIAAEFQKHRVAAKVADNVGAAVVQALDMASPEDMILATGSFFIVAEVIEKVKNLQPELYTI